MTGALLFSLVEDFRRAMVPDNATEEDVWTLETDLGMLLAMPFQACVHSAVTVLLYGAAANSASTGNQ